MTKPKLIFLPPPFTRTYFNYQDINSDRNLRKEVTDHFFDLLHEKIKFDDRFKKYKKHSTFLNSRQGYELIFKILKHFTIKYNYNWYDLRPQQQEVILYISKKLDKHL